MLQAPKEVIFLFNVDEKICDELAYAQFERLIGGNQRLNSFALSRLKAVYCLLEAQSDLVRVVFFTATVNEHGVVDPSFNIPLRDLAQRAGPVKGSTYPDMRQASRGQCPIPWHAMNLWEPSTAQCLDEIKAGLGPSYCSNSLVATLDQEQAHAPLNQDLFPDGDFTEHSRASLALQRECEAKLTSVFGGSGKVSLQEIIRLHAEQLRQIKATHQAQLAAQQETHQTQSRRATDEIRALTAALRQERSRNQRLQCILRGDCA
jgi:hypothetical protein